MNAEAWRRHQQANARGLEHYLDPETGYQVFTEHGLRQRGRCCGSGCRHCPYAHEQTPLARRGALSQVATWLRTGQDPGGPVDVLFWSGGKDSFLAWRALRREAARSVVLFTTFDAGERRVAHQDVRIDEVVRQAARLDAPLIGVPLQPGRDYVEQVATGLALCRSIARLVFGDLHLEQIRAWREAALAPLAATRGASLHFPLWHVSYEALLADLEASGVPCTVAAITDPRLEHTVGARFDREWLDRLPADIDPFGERGEFHTLARVWDGDPATGIGTPA